MGCDLREGGREGGREGAEERLLDGVEPREHGREESRDDPPLPCCCCCCVACGQRGESGIERDIVEKVSPGLREKRSLTNTTFWRD